MTSNSDFNQVMAGTCVREPRSVSFGLSLTSVSFHLPDGDLGGRPGERRHGLIRISVGLGHREAAQQVSGLLVGAFDCLVQARRVG